jgi:hypothetical protein
MEQNSRSREERVTPTPGRPAEGGALPVSDDHTHITAPSGYNDLQSAVRFPVKLPISVKSSNGESQTETENVSANGVLFQLDSEMPVGSPVDFTISLPASVLGADADVQIDCHGRVVRSFEENGHRGVGVVIDEYRFERR